MSIPTMTDIAKKENAVCLNSLDRIDHIAVAVDDVARAVDWYRETFKCEIEYQDKTWAFLRFENIKLALVVPHQHPPHIAFLHDNAEQFGALKTHRDGTRSVYIADSAGNSVEIVAKDSVKD
ncbi:MAG TPA: VOC family protein [Candidatus Melainabacteria bacterium]|nr:VOC family protein [Candidatus Melainabacteria bacterium]